MSMDAILATRDLSKKHVNSSEKLFLLSLAIRCDDTHLCWPSIQCICQDTSLDRKTVIKLRQSLLQKNLIQYTGRRVGRSEQIPEMKLLYVEPWQNGITFEPVDKSVDNFLTSPNNGTGTCPNNGTGTSPKCGTRKRTLEKTNRKKSFCADAPKSQKLQTLTSSQPPRPQKTKAQWRTENSKRPEWADKKDIAAASKVQMDREAQHIERNNEFKRSPPPQEFHDLVKKMKSDLAPH